MSPLSPPDPLPDLLLRLAARADAMTALEREFVSLLTTLVAVGWQVEPRQCRIVQRLAEAYLHVSDL